MPVEPAGARVVAVDGRGRPTLLRHTLGGGSTILCTYPLEHMAARRPEANPESTWRLYSALAEAAGVARPVRVDDPRVLVGRIRSLRGETVLFQNCSGDALEIEPRLAGGVALERPEGPLELAPYGVATVRRTGLLDGRPTFADSPVAAGSEGGDAPRG